MNEAPQIKRARLIPVVGFLEYLYFALLFVGALSIMSGRSVWSGLAIIAMGLGVNAFQNHLKRKYLTPEESSPEPPSPAEEQQTGGLTNVPPNHSKNRKADIPEYGFHDDSGYKF